MKPESEQVQQWDDIIFEKRNKDYGAYTIRKSYDDNVLTGWVMSLGVITLVFLSSFLSLEKKTPVATRDKPTIHPGLPPVITPNVKPPSIPNAPRQINQNFPPVAVINEPIDEPIAPVEPPALGTGNGIGDPQTGSAEPGTSIGTVAPPEPPKPEWILNPEVAPEFEGGYTGMMQFLQRKLRYPSTARRRDIEGTVYVSFVISPTGAVTHVEVLKGIGHGCDEEATRVISMMDKWKPGLQNKMPVAVKLVLPIKFKLDS